MVASALSSPSRGLVVYRRHEPEKLVLYQTVERHLHSFLTAAEEAERPVPAFVQRERVGTSIHETGGQPG